MNEGQVGDVTGEHTSKTHDELDLDFGIVFPLGEVEFPVFGVAVIVFGALQRPRRSVVERQASQIGQVLEGIVDVF